MGKGMNPVEAHRRELKKKEALKIKQEREKKKKETLETQEKFKNIEQEYKALISLEKQRTLTIVEKVKKSELKSLLDAREQEIKPRRDRLTQLGEQIPSGLFDPLAEEHRSFHDRKAIIPSTLPVPSNDVENESSEEDSELDEDFLPSLPKEPPPRHHNAPNLDPIPTVMGGYPPPPMGPLPTHPAQMEPPHISRAKKSAQPTSTKPAGRTDSAIISAAPQLRNIHKETIALVPSAVQRDGATKKRKVIKVDDSKNSSAAAQEEDVAYAAFLKEMEGLV